MIGFLRVIALLIEQIHTRILHPENRQHHPNPVIHSLATLPNLLMCFRCNIRVCICSINKAITRKKPIIHARERGHTSNTVNAKNYR